MGAVVNGLLLASLGTGVRADTFTVTSNAAAGDYTLAWAVAQANAAGGVNTINFNLSGSNAIVLNDTLDIGTQVTIDGSNGGNKVVISCSDTSTAVFQLLGGSGGSVLRNLAVVSGGTGIYIMSDGNTVAGCAVGTDFADGRDLGNAIGIMIEGNNNQIGGSTAADRNIIAGNTGYGLLADGAYGLKVVGNYIGVSSGGNTEIANQIGVMLRNGVSQARIGGNRNSGEGNVISGNSAVNCYLLGETTTGNQVAGNIIGAKPDLTGALYNHCGVGLRQCSNNIIGLPQDGYENIIVGHHSFGMFLGDTPTPHGNVIRNNFIGVTPDGLKLGNETGLMLAGADGNLIGGNRNSLERNVIAGNDTEGVNLMGNGNTVSGNYIGTTPQGAAGLGNLTGINFTGNGNLIGGSNQDYSNPRGNVVSGQNNAYGIIQTGGGGNRIIGNTVGLNPEGTAAMPNDVGLSLTNNCTNTVIGGAGPDARNVIAGNNQSAIYVDGSSGHVITGNYFGTDVTGTQQIQNGATPIHLNNAAGCRIGGQPSAEANVICGSGDGVLITSEGSVGNTVVGNWIGLLADRSLPSQRLINAVSLGNSASGNFIGMRSINKGNLIAAVTNGIAATGDATVSNAFYTNTITAFTGQGVSLSNNANANKSAPVITLADTDGVSGTAQAGDYVEVFLAERGAGFKGGSLRFLGASTADAAGSWSLVPNGLSGGEYACALATDAGNNTSKFSDNVLATGYLVTPVVTPVVETPTPGIPAPGATPTPDPPNSDNPGSSDKLVLVSPNPARDQATLILELDEASDIKAEIYNIAGERVAELQASLQAGRQNIVWDTRQLAPGIYIVRIVKNGEQIDTRKIAIIK